MKEANIGVKNCKKLVMAQELFFVYHHANNNLDQLSCLGKKIIQMLYKQETALLTQT